MHLGLLDVPSSTMFLDFFGLKWSIFITWNTRLGDSEIIANPYAEALAFKDCSVHCIHLTGGRWFNNTTGQVEAQGNCLISSVVSNNLNILSQNGHLMVFLTLQYIFFR